MFDKPYEYIKEQLNGFVPDTAIILGSGFGVLTSEIKNQIVIPYADIPEFPQTTVAGHLGRFCAGRLGKHNVIFMQGRFHLYEGLEPRTIADIVGMLKKLGVEQMIITNAAGSLDIDMPPGSLMLIKDHINFSGQNPLIGYGSAPTFPDMKNAYDAEMRKKMKYAAAKNNILLYEGVYIMALGPNYETPSEVRLFKQFGGNAVGMSTVPEVISAARFGIKIVAISAISNLGTGLTDKIQNHEDVMITVAESIENISQLIRTFLED